MLLMLAPAIAYAVMSMGQAFPTSERSRVRTNTSVPPTEPSQPTRIQWDRCVNGAVQNFEEFGKAFQCARGKPMYPEKSCRVW
jgi:predicted metalloendopeptidase